ncbi:MAG: LysR family transcriptional regulator [Rhodoferax sp.]|nr:LysR family transcriptional regulator [Rhodoferax sp.]MBP9929140.1 LysR family transcriptional regulator [Rhodoferax sp.]HQX60302.1 LysR family transcriptional regulator [Burkholderiaceae bacterium]HQZ05303.1 LysR family transcriptional regulator [Burkholderiaceae bacterium]HRA62358.1 LysR family transcriptional regulator [Burkholderiaceae bacterium]
MALGLLDLNLLRTFDAIYRHHSLSAAAIELGLTQPAISAALKRLRSHFDNPLFVRTSHGMRPTPHADAMSAAIARALDTLRGIGQAQAFSRATSTVHYRVYINDVGMLVVMPQVVRNVSELAPHAKISVIDLRPDEVVDALDRGHIDLAIGYFLGMPNWARQQTLRKTRYVCAVRSDHPQITDSLSLEQFLNAKHGMYATSGSPHSVVDETLARLNLSRDISLRVPRFAALPFLIATSDLIATIPEDLGQTFSRLLDIKLFAPPFALAPFEIKQYWHERHHAEPAFHWLRSVVRKETGAIVRQLARKSAQ